MRRRVATRGVLQAFAAAAVMCATPAFAVCGDADGDGRISVSDGVQALRAAANLSTLCDTDCDIDGSGGISVSDGVNILRKAAGLTVVDACPTADPLASLIGHTIDIFGPLTKVGAVGATAAGTPSPCENSAGSFQQSASGLTFDDCLIDNVSFTGFLGVGDGTLDFSNLEVRRANDVLTLQGSLSISESGGNSQLSGVLSGDSIVLGSYTITFQQVVSDAQGNTLDGVLVFDTSNADIQDVVEVRVTLTGGTALPVLVSYTDETTGTFTYNPDTGVLTPVTGPTPTPTPTPPAANVRLFNIDDDITAFLNDKPVLQAASTGPNATNDTGLVPVDGLACGDNRFDFVVNNAGNGGGYTFGVQLEVGGALIVNRTCGQAGFQGCDNNNLTQGEVARDVTFFCVPCGPCSASTAGTCADPLLIPPSGRIQYHGQATGSGTVPDPCGSSGVGPESIFRFTPPVTDCYEFSTCGTSFDSQLSLGDGPPLCPGANGPIEESCFLSNESCADGTTRALVFGNFSGGQPITILLDGIGGSQSGSFLLDARPSGRCVN